MVSEGQYVEDIRFREFALAYLKPRYLSLSIHAFIAFYATFKLLFLTVNATDVLERWVFELTPLTLAEMPDLYALVASVLIAGTNTGLHFADVSRNRLLRIILTVVMVAGLILGLRTSPYYFDALNMGRLIVMAALLVTVPLDHIDVIRDRIRLPRGRKAETDFWPAAPQEFDDVMTSVDEALGLLDTSQDKEEADEELSELATDLLEDLMTTISDSGTQTSEVEGRPDSLEIERRRVLFEKRLEAIDRRLASDPKDVDALFAKATYLAMRGRHDDSMRVLDEVTRLSPYYPGVWHLKAKVYEMMGDSEKAELCRKRARSL